ncbi:MAG: DNA polymerase I [Desulfatiglans sp.]|jgi:DNA polymerase-1|nr:DNA polymerase I [Desulfatiglans sp.]
MAYEKKTVYLVDGSSYIHRAYHAIRNLTNSKGLPTNAVFGFTKMLLKLISDNHPEYLAVVFDARGPTFRHEIYQDYKANRPSMPEDMAIQIPIIKSIVNHLNIAAMEMQGFEADDLIGTLARISEEKGFGVVIVTGDKDFRQVVTPDISLLDTMKGAVTDYNLLKEIYGFEPEKFVDVMGLAGDAGDNIPGVPGVGEKTAVKLINEFGSFENVYEHVGDIKGKKLKENLKKYHSEALLSKRLVTIDRFVPISNDIKRFTIGEPDHVELTEIFRELEFKGLWDQFGRKEEVETDYTLCLSLEDVKVLAQRIKEEGIVSFDTETTSKDSHNADLVGLAFSCDDHSAWYVPLAHSYPGVPRQPTWPETLDILRDLFEDDKIRKVGQNIKYDAEVLKLHGVDLKGIYFDTMIASYVINPGLRQHNLDFLAQHYLNHKMIAFSDIVGKGRGTTHFGEVEIYKACEYSCEDADITLRLMTLLKDKLESDGNVELFHDLEMRLLPVLMDMEMTGIKIDIPFFAKMSDDFSRKIKNIENDIFEEAGMEFNINSPQQLGHVLFDKLGLPVQKKTAKTKKYSTDLKVLKKLAALPFRIPGLVIQYRAFSKLKSTYLDAMVKMVDTSTGRLHTSFNQTVAATGRLSSSEPNLQNIPIRSEEGREIRKGFIAEEGCYLVSADYSQIELRVFAHYSKDEAFIKAFREDKDIHTRTASEILGVPEDLVNSEMRRIAKAINFGIIYGMGPRKLSDELEIDYARAKDYIQSYYERYEGVVRYKEEMIEKALKEGYVCTLFNRRRYLPDIKHSNQVIRAEAERMAVNTPIQGTAADLIKRAMINIHERLNKEHLGAKMLLQVHDELVFEVPEEELAIVMPLVKEEMERAYALRVPLKVDINKGKNWDEAH